MLNVLVACAFHFSGVPFASVELAVAGSSHADSAIVEHYGARSTVAVAAQTPGEDDWIHVILDADRPGNELIMHVKRGEGPRREGRLINPALPIGGEMSGDCEISPEPVL